MANLIKLNAGAQSAFATLGITAGNWNSLANGSFVLMDNAVDNATNLDLFVTISGQVTVGGTTTASSFLSLYAMPLNQDAATYGDGTASGSAVPGASYWVFNAFPKVGITSGSAIFFTFPPFQMDRIGYKFGIANNLGVAFNATAAAACQYRTSNLNGNG